MTFAACLLFEADIWGKLYKIEISVVIVLVMVIEIVMSTVIANAMLMIYIRLYLSYFVGDLQFVFYNCSGNCNGSDNCNGNCNCNDYWNSETNSRYIKSSIFLISSSTICYYNCQF